MDLEEADQWLNSSSMNGTPKRIPSNLQPYPNPTSNYTIDIDIDTSFPTFTAPPKPETLDETRPELWNPTAVLTNLSFLEEKIHELQSLVHLIARTNSGDLAARQRQHQLMTADVASVIGQLISAAGSLLPSINTPPPEKFPDPEPDPKKDENADEADDNDTLPPGAYEILQLEKDEILAPHTHFCAICGKGFKRDANLRMHMRGHGDQYKTAAALAKPAGPSQAAAPATRYSCPFSGCKRNKSHRKFQPLKTILCVKNHYKRTHCDKSFACSRCKTKKFSVIADLKTHEKHCGKDRWLCSCGTTFSRKDKLFGHISLFQGHTPAIPAEEFAGGAWAASEAKDGLDDPRAYFSGMDFNGCDFGGFSEFPRSQFEDPENSLFFLPCNSYPQKSDDL